MYLDCTKMPLFQVPLIILQTPRGHRIAHCGWYIQSERNKLEFQLERLMLPCVYLPLLEIFSL